MPVVFAGWPGQVKVRVFEGSNVHVGDVLVPSGHGNGTAKVNQSSAVFKDELGFAVGCHGNMPPQVLMLMGTPGASLTTGADGNMPRQVLRMAPGADYLPGARNGFAEHATAPGFGSRCEFSHGIAVGSAAAAMLSTEAGVAAGIAVAGAVSGALLLGGIVGAVDAAFQPSSGRHNFPTLPEGERSKSHGVKPGKWMVLTEEGWGNVVFYPFESQEGAHRFFYELRASRPKSLLNTEGQEQLTGGWNSFALPTLRSHYGGSMHNSQNGFTAFEPGNVIALHCPSHNRFIRMMGDNVDARGGLMDFEQLPLDWDSERLTVVDAGGGEIALFSCYHNRFVRMDGENVDGKGGQIEIDQLPQSWGLERFVIVDAGDGLIALHSKSQNRFIRVDDSQDVNSKGGLKDVDALPSAYNSERFRVRFVSPPPSEQ